tara:strand:+ start:4279 stop:4560 length:282 start_codon:yes stop_codon:yes gene_type:complete
MLIGYIEDAHKLPDTRGSGMRVVAKLYNPSEKERKYDLRIPIMAYGKPAKLMRDFGKSGDLVSIIGRVGSRSRSVCVIAELIKTLDEDTEYDI